jgi:hypothetical protein
MSRRGGLLALSGLLLVSGVVFAAAPKNPPRAAGRAAKPPVEAGAKAGEPAAPATPAPLAVDSPASGEAPVAGEGAPQKAVDDLGARPTPAVDTRGSKISPLTPAPNEFPGRLLPTPSTELDRLLGDIATLRGRVAALTTTLFKSRLRVVIEEHGSEARIEALSVNLDDGVVFAAPERFSAEDERVVYEHAVAPGQHVLGLDIERYDLRGRNFRTWQSSRFSVVVPEGKTVEAHFVLQDSSDMAVDFPDDQDGEYELDVRLRARVAP